MIETANMATVGKAEAPAEAPAKPRVRQYIGTRLVEAEPMSLHQYHRRLGPHHRDPSAVYGEDRDGYGIVTEDEAFEWVHREEFERTYRPLNPGCGRPIETHRVEGAAADVEVRTADARGDGNANHVYVLTAGQFQCGLFFQKGPIGEAGQNGITNEALLAVVIDRLEGFQSGAYACDANEDALGFARMALDCLKERTAARIARGVEGTHQV